MKIYYYIVSGGELWEVVLGVYGGKGAGKWCSALGLWCMANFRLVVAGIPGVAVLALVKKSRASTD